MQRNKVLVTGGSGFIGSHLVQKLLEQGDEVIVFDNFSLWGCSRNLANLSHPDKLRVIRGDVRDYDAVQSVVKRVDCVFHLAVASLLLSLTDPMQVHEVNSTGTLNVCRACQKHGNKKLVYVSSSEVYGTAKYVPMDEKHPMAPTTPYGASKAASELYVRSFHNAWNLPVTIVRPFNTYGPRCRKDRYSAVITKFVSRTMNGKAPIIYGDGKQTRDFTYVSDTVEGIVKAAECDRLAGEPVNIARGEEVSILKLVNVILALLDEKGKIEPIFKKERKGDVRRHLADTSKAEKILQFKPAVSIEEGLKRYIDWVKSNNVRK